MHVFLLSEPEKQGVSFSDPEHDLDLASQNELDTFQGLQAALPWNVICSWEEEFPPAGLAQYPKVFFYTLMSAVWSQSNQTIVGWESVNEK